MRESQRRVLRRVAGMAAVALVTSGIGVARGDNTVVITQAPVLSGAAQAPGELTAGGASWFPPGAKPHWQWQRCVAAAIGVCTDIPDATKASYAVDTADLGTQLRAVLTVTSGRKDPAVAATAASDVVVVATAPAPQDPPKSTPPKQDPPKSTPPKKDPPKRDPPKSTPPKQDPPKSTPPKQDPPKSTPPKQDPPKQDPPKKDPPKQDPPKGSPRQDPPSAGPAPATAPMTPSAPAAAAGTSFDTTRPVAVPASRSGVKAASKRRIPALKPFPTVRVKGVLTMRGARIQRLVVRAPRRTRVAVTCAGGGCGMRKWAGGGGVSRVRGMEAVLRQGARITVLVTRPGYIGKRTDLVVRKGRAPLRKDRCVNGSRIVACRG